MPRDLAEDIVRTSIVRYFDARRARIPGFIDRHFSWSGAWSLNRKAFGHDLYRAPLNVAMVGPVMGLKAVSRGLEKAGKPWLAKKVGDKSFHFDTDVTRELEWRIHTDLLEVPYSQPGRHMTKDALADEIFGNQAFASALEKAVNDAVDAAGPRNQEQLRAVLSDYLQTRAANAEVVNLAICLVAGAAVAHKVTPGVLTLGPTMASAFANKAAITSFPLGASAGALFYGAFPVAPSAALAAGTTGGLFAVIALATAFSGIVSDPMQKATGLHARRLERLVDTLEDNMLYDEVVKLKVRDHYVARIIDLFDALGALAAYAR